MNDPKIKKIAKQQGILQLSIKQSGDFGYKAKLQYYVGTKQIGKVVYLNYYNRSTGLLEKTSKAMINNLGYGNFTLTQGSDYIITKK